MRRFLSKAIGVLTGLTLLLPSMILAQDTVPPQLFGCSAVDVAGISVGTTAQTSTGTWQTPSGFNLQPGGGFTTPFETKNIYGQTSGSTQFNYGFTTVGYRFVDNPPTSPPQNNAYCTFFVRMGVNNDGTIPTVLNCPESITQPIASSQTTAVVSWTEPRATDNNGVVRRSWRSHAPNTAFPVGTTPVTYQWIDPSNANSQAQCVFTVTVSTTGTDGVVPSLTCPADVVASANGTATWTPPTPTDASGIVSTTSTLTPGSVVQEGFTTVTYNTVDGTGNRASCSFIVRRIPSDQYVPVITSCPTNIQQTVTSSGASGIVTWTEPTAYDDGGHVRLVMQTHSPNTAFPVGITPVEYRFQDTRENVARCVFTVELTVTGGDATPPTFTNCPTTSPVFTITSGLTTFVTWPVPQATDNQGTPTVTQIQGVSPGTNLAAGQYTIRYQAQDAAGNTAFCMFTVLVQQLGREN
ncbi:hyalin-like [Patiria miniata]|uniref:HYR domain-containing protein n=1 Tax=Patiria miniata TaxID=46514 RepID=A0A914B1G7_PATMI|nr:hyalin-like [Patiria miniata]